ncbi:MAG: protein kinase [Xenococcaceae cyanobacterium]
MSAKITLTVTKGSLQGQKFVCEEHTICIIGRAYDCNPQLPDDEEYRTISRYHCLLDINPPNICVRDFGSKNGTYVNGKKIGQRQPYQTPEEATQINFPVYDLQEGDFIGLGNIVFRVGIEVDRELASTPKGAQMQVYSATISPKEPNLLEIITYNLKQPAADNNFVAIQGYKIVRSLAKGGFGEVYLGLNKQTGELVVLKVMLPKVAANLHNTGRFLHQMAIAKALQHRNVVQLLDYGYSDGTFFFTLEYCEGGRVADLMQQRGGRLSIDEAVPIILQTLDALEYIHNAEIPYVKQDDGSFGKGRGLVHCDIKPSNIFLTQIGGDRIAKVGSIAKISECGLSKAFDRAGLSSQTMTDISADTPVFMPRQQVINFKYAKPEVDVWATAASLYNMLTGAYPRDFRGRDPFLLTLLTDTVPIRQRDASIPKPLAEVIDLALVDNPEIYFKSAASFKQAMESVL